MEEKNTSVFTNGLIWGVIIGLVGVIYSVVLYVLDESLNQNLGYLGLVIVLGGMIYAVYNFRESVRGGILPFGQAFGFGVVIAVTYALISSIYSYLLMTVIDPGLQEKMLEMVMERMLDQGIPEDQLDQAMNFSRRLMKPGLSAIMGVFSVSVMGTIIAVIVAAIFKREAPEGVV